MVSSGGDFNGTTGHDDLVIGAYLYNQDPADPLGGDCADLSDLGKAYIFFGDNINWQSPPATISADDAEGRRRNGVVGSTGIGMPIKARPRKVNPSAL